MSATTRPSIELRPLSGTLAEAEVVQRAYEAAPASAMIGTTTGPVAAPRCDWRYHAPASISSNRPA